MLKEEEEEEQDRFSSQEESARAELSAAEADLDKWQEAITLAIRLAGSCDAAHLKASPKVRVHLNQAVLQAVYIKDRQLPRSGFTEVFEALFSRPSSNERAMVGRSVGSGVFSELVDQWKQGLSPRVPTG